MLFEHALLSSFLFASALLVLAIPSSRYDPRVARQRERRQSQSNNGLQLLTDAVSTSESLYSVNWAGAVWDMPNETFSYIAATLTVPTLTGEDGTGVSTWVGIDGYACTNVALQVGVDSTLSNGQVSYSAWYDWYPSPYQVFSGIDISAGDNVRLIVVAYSATSGYVIIDNQTKGQQVNQNVSSSTALCGQSAEWTVQDFIQGDHLIPLANFGTAIFTDALATGLDGTDTHPYTPSGATILNMMQNGQVLTDVSIDGSSVSITYV